MTSLTQLGTPLERPVLPSSSVDLALSYVKSTVGLCVSARVCVCAGWLVDGREFVHTCGRAGGRAGGRECVRACVP